MILLQISETPDNMGNSYNDKIKVLLGASKYYLDMTEKDITGIAKNSEKQKPKKLI